MVCVIGNPILPASKGRQVNLIIRVFIFDWHSGSFGGSLEMIKPPF
jgi:hypothetical protein